MASSIEFSIKYRYACEVCGEQTRWFTSSNTIQTGSAINPNMVNSLLSLGEVKFAHAQKENLARDGRYNTAALDLSQGEKCPNCGARQSWYPVTAPLAKQGASIALTLLGWTSLGLLLSLIPVFMDFYEGVVILPAIGLLFGIYRCIRNSRKDKAEREAQLAAVKAFEEEIAARPVRNKPEIDWSSENAVFIND